MCRKPIGSLGFTLIELMVTIAIAAILISIAIPSFKSTITSNRLTTSANDLVTAFNLARSEAVKRGVQVTVLRKGEDSTQWESGWDVFVDYDANQSLDEGDDANLCEPDPDASDTTPAEDCLLRTFDALPDGYSLRTGNSTYKDYAAYLPSGLSKLIVGETFTLCGGTGTDIAQRTIIVNSTGRPRVSVTTGTCP